MITKVRGTHDIIDTTLFNFIIKSAAAHFRRAHFNEIITPILEPTDLFKRTLGLATDIVSKEMFTINSSGDNDTICLRPEATASTMRAFLEHGNLSTPFKIFSHGSMFRHERPQKGRFREFHQFNIEMIGAENISHDAFLLCLLDQLFQNTFKLDTFALMINFLGCSQDRIDFKPKLYAFLAEHENEICNDCKARKEKNIMRVFDCKTPKCQEIYRKAPSIAQHLCEQCAIEWQTLKEQLEILSVTYTVSPHLVRGLDYYEKTVFEFVSAHLGAQSTFCGGGRYNQLATMLGSKNDYPSIGAAIGIERLMLMLEPINALQLPQEPALHAIVPLSKEQHNLALLVGDLLFDSGLCIELLLDSDSIKSSMRKANKLGAHYALIIGPEEQEKGLVTVKTMMTGIEEKIAQRDLVAYLKK
ncbi:histidine--tRNA ligase [Candidatus Dependentiae bacterium]|nr:histidine--tRNA ligase [Candidatus Dependentiae bacterium]